MSERQTYLIPSFGYTVTSAFLGHPFDTVKIRLQSARHNNIIQSVKQTYAKEGIKAFYRGVLIPLSFNTMIRPLEFYMYENYKNTIPGWKGHFFAGALSGIAISSVSCPLHLIKTKMQSSDKDTFKNIFDCIKKTKQTRGYPGFIQGFRINFLREVTFNTCFLGFYGNIKNNLPKSNITNFFAGGVSGAIMYTTLFPIDTLRTVIQSDLKKTISIKDAYYSVLNRGGITQLWKGIPLTYIRVFPVSGISMMVYEFIKKHTNY